MTRPFMLPVRRASVQEIADEIDNRISNTTVVSEDRNPRDGIDDDKTVIIGIADVALVHRAVVRLARPQCLTAIAAFCLGQGDFSLDWDSIGPWK